MTVVAAVLANIAAGSPPQDFAGGLRDTTGGDPRRVHAHAATAVTLRRRDRRHPKRHLRDGGLVWTSRGRALPPDDVFADIGPMTLPD
jgi:hypothetical protein